MTAYDECTKCGAMVGSMSKHRRWHEELTVTERLAKTAATTADAAFEQSGTALEEAEKASNVLYQNGIGI